MPKKRLCKICHMPLSMYNKESICFCHQIGMQIRETIPITKCTSFNSSAIPLKEVEFRNKNSDLKKSDDEERESLLVSAPFLKPGDPGYNEQAFTEIIIGAINKDGSIYEVNLKGKQVIFEEEK